MPIARISGKLVCFAHVPRCGGTSMEFYLDARFGPLAFRNPRYLDLPGPMRWTRTAPQHVAATDLGRLFPADFFDETFAIVRHPLDRLKSVFRFQRDVEGIVAARQTFERWLERVLEQEKTRPFVLDNHIRPMSEMVPDGARIFHLEQGMDPVIAWLDALAGGPSPDHQLKVKNNYAGRLAWAKRAPGPAPEVTDRVRDLMAARYGRDFERFGYAPESDSEPDPESGPESDSGSEPGPDPDRTSGQTSGQTSTSPSGPAPADPL